MIGLVFVIVGAALAVILAGIGSALGVATAGQVGAGVVSEDPEKFGKVLLLQALAGTQGIYGFLAAIMALQKVGFLGGEAVLITPEIGWQIMVASLPIAFTGLLSGWLQGKVAASGMGIVAKKPEALGKAIILSAMVETYAVLGLLVSILLINGVNVG